MTGEGFVIVDTVEDVASIFANPAHLCHIFYREDNPSVPEFAAKWWEADGATHLTLYYRDHFEYYVAKGKRADITSPSAFTVEDESAPNERGALPIFHYRRDRRSHNGELANVVPLNNAGNKLFADMMVAAEYGAFKQRWLISNAEATNLKLGSTELWQIPAGDGEGQQSVVGQFDATELVNFTGAMDRIASVIAIVTRTPKHYLLQSGDVSGEALLAMEAPLTRKAQSYIDRLTVTWRQAAAYALSLSGIVVDPQDITPVWKDARTVQPLSEAQTLKTRVEAGVPLVTAMRQGGADTEELDQLATDLAEGQTRDADLASVMLAKARADFNTGGANGGMQ